MVKPTRLTRNGHAASYGLGFCAMVAIPAPFGERDQLYTLVTRIKG